MVTHSRQGRSYIPKDARNVWQGTVFSAWQWEQKLYDGTVATFEGLQRPDTAHTVGVLDNGHILLAEDTQPRRASVLTPAGGIVDPGETAAQAAQREFREETGYQIGTLLPWHSYQPSSKVQWMVHAFIGRDLRRIGDPELEPGEKIQLREFTFDEFLALGHDPKLRDLVIRIILLEALLSVAKRAAFKKLLYG